MSHIVLRVPPTTKNGTIFLLLANLLALRRTYLPTLHCHPHLARRRWGRFCGVIA